MHPRISISGCIHRFIRQFIILLVHSFIHPSVCPSIRPYIQGLCFHQKRGKMIRLTRCMLASLWDSLRETVHPSVCQPISPSAIYPWIHSTPKINTSAQKCLKSWSEMKFSQRSNLIRFTLGSILWAKGLNSSMKFEVLGSSSCPKIDFNWL